MWMMFSPSSFKHLSIINYICARKCESSPCCCHDEVGLEQTNWGFAVNLHQQSHFPRPNRASIMLEYRNQFLMLSSILAYVQAHFYLFSFFALAPLSLRWWTNLCKEDGGEGGETGNGQ